MNKHIVRTVIAAALLGNAAIASADTAEAAFKRGKAALKAGHVHEACQEYETSDKLEPKLETELNLAACYAEDGKPVTAANLYRSVANRDTKPERKKTSIEKAVKLEAKAPKLRLLLSTRPDGLAITVDGVAVSATAKDIPVDAGPHEVVVTAPASRATRRRRSTDRGRSSTSSCASSPRPSPRRRRSRCPRPRPRR